MSCGDFVDNSSVYVFALDLCASNSSDPVVLTEREFIDLRESYTKLSEGLAIEEKYEILLSNYEDFEKELLLGALGSILRHPQGYDEMRSVSFRINKRLVNLLSAARLYTDHIQHHVLSIVSHGEGQSGTLKGLWERQYDQHAEFRFMEGLRNYVQHRGFPAHETTLQSWWEMPLTPASRLVSGIAISSTKAKLKEDKKFKKSVLDEVGEKIDLKSMARRYMECLNEIHVEVREMTSKPLDDARKMFLKYISLAQDKYGKEHNVFEVRCRNDQGENKVGAESLPILLEWDDIRVELTAKNRKLINLHKHFATGEIKRGQQ